MSVGLMNSLQTWLGINASAAEIQVLPYTAPKVESIAAIGTSRLGEYFSGPAGRTESLYPPKAVRKPLKV